MNRHKTEKNRVQILDVCDENVWLNIFLPKNNHLNFLSRIPSNALVIEFDHSRFIFQIGIVSRSVMKFEINVEHSYQTNYEDSFLNSIHHRKLFVFL